MSQYTCGCGKKYKLEACFNKHSKLCNMKPAIVKEKVVKEKVVKEEAVKEPALKETATKDEEEILDGKAYLLSLPAEKLVKQLILYQTIIMGQSEAIEELEKKNEELKNTNTININLEFKMEENLDLEAFMVNMRSQLQVLDELDKNTIGKQTCKVSTNVI